MILSVTVLGSNDATPLSVIGERIVEYLEGGRAVAGRRRPLDRDPVSKIDWMCEITVGYEPDGAAKVVGVTHVGVVPFGTYPALGNKVTDYDSGRMVIDINPIGSTYRHRSSPIQGSDDRRGTIDIALLNIPDNRSSRSHDGDVLGNCGPIDATV